MIKDDILGIRGDNEYVVLLFGFKLFFDVVMMTSGQFNDYMPEKVARRVLLVKKYIVFSCSLK